MSSPYPPAPQPPDPAGTPYPSWNGGTPPLQPRPLQRKPRLWLHLTLFVLTAGSTWMVGGAPYAISLLVILTAHEFGHYFAARHYRVKATLPYFIPFPPLGGVPTLGTLGAVIRMSPYIPNRRALFDIAAAGPIAGLIVALPVSFIGIALSEPADPSQTGNLITLGDPLLFQVMQWILFGSRGENVDLVLHSMGFAGWVGLFVTALNLLPISQLDGGHINYSIFGRRSRLIAAAAFVTLAVMTFVKGFHYSVILVLLWFMGIGHPPTLNDGVDLGRTRRIVGALLLLVFILCFTPSPFQV
jgi:membrane-associated protease RseP (regulator of RpoE activity)